MLRLCYITECNNPVDLVLMLCLCHITECNSPIDLVFMLCLCYITECNNPIDLVFMLDSSGSINQGNFMRVLNFIRELSSRLDVEGGSARISVMTFADDVRLVSVLYYDVSVPHLLIPCSMTQVS